MAKLIFRYGAMGSSKTANALMVRYNYLEKSFVWRRFQPSAGVGKGTFQYALQRRENRADRRPSDAWGQ